ncbi:MAG TPA: GLUG motif-containing protein [Rhizomicrobium sp.]|jgi:hypothetical protein|nr:GLUG motif-containing protein [Rhizomicrobium sp.]
MRPALSALCGNSSLLVFATIGLPALMGIQAAYAAVTISSKATKNMSCSGGVCEPTATNAVLNVGDLETMLASGDATVTTTGSGMQANDIVVSAPLSWSTPNALALDANRYLTIDAAVSVSGMGGLALADNGGLGSLSFGAGGDATFANLSSTLSINGTSYTLMDTISSLAGAVRSNPAGTYAFVQNYDAKKDGTYSAPPVATTFTGVFEGLGNTISNLKIKDAADEEVGFFEYIDGGAVHDIGFEKAKVSAGASSVILGVLAGYVLGAEEMGNSYSGVVTGSWASGTISDTASTYGQVGGLVGSACNYGSGYQMDAVAGSHASVKISGGQSNFAGGLVGYSCGDGLIENSYATAAVTAGTCSYVGGLAGASTAYVEDSFATGAATTGSSGECGPPPSAGGLVGYNFGLGSSPGTITNSYSTGAVSGGTGTNVGGMVGLSDDGTISDSYSTGAPSAGSGSYVGGFVGDDSSATLTDTYWDTTTSGITNASQGAGNISNAPGITGLSTSQLQSGLPPGFRKGVWKERTKINGGLPYLVANPPPK